MQHLQVGAIGDINGCRNRDDEESARLEIGGLDEKRRCLAAAAPAGSTSFVASPTGAQLLEAGISGVEAVCRTLLAELDRERQPDITQADHGDWRVRHVGRMD